MASAGIATRLAALIPLCIAQPICLGIEAFNVSSTVPRTTRSRWLLIRSSSIVMTLFSRLGVSQGRAPLSQNRKCERLFNTKARSAVASARAAAIRNQQREEFSAVLCQLSPCCSLLASIPQESTPNSLTPFWKNDFFESLDAAALIGMLCAKRLARYVEIGSGNSTKFARYAIQQMHLRTSITSIDPEPRAIINSLCDIVVRRRLEDCDLSFFDQLEPGDFPLFDGSHRVFIN